MVTRSNKKFREDGLRKNLAYAITLSNPKNPNPDYKAQHPSECQASNPNRIKEITTRIKHQHDLYVQMRALRLKKATGERRT